MPSSLKIREMYATWPRCQRYLEQVEACDVLIQRHHLQVPEAADLLDRAGTYVREHMWYAQAEGPYIGVL